MNESTPQNNKLGTQPIGKLLFSMAIPTVLAQLVNLLYNIVDRIYVGRIPGSGSLALAGLGVTFPIILLVSAFAALIGMGGATRMSIAMGRKEHDTAEKLLGNSITMLVIASLILSGVFMLAKEPVLMAFGASEATLPYASDYLSIYLFGTLFVQVAMGLNAFITNQGFARTGMITVLIGCVLNIILDPIFIFGFGMGVRGAALATIISQGVSAVWVMWFLCSKKSLLRIRQKNLILSGKIVGSILTLGISPFIMQATECLIQLTFNKGMQTYGNDMYVALMSIMFSLMQLVFMPMMGLAQGAQPIISYNYGAKNMERTQKAFHYLLTTALIFTVSVVGIVLMVPQFFLGLFTPDTALIELGTAPLRVFLFGMMAMGAQSACQQTFMALGEAKISVFLALLRKVILLLPLALILPHVAGLGVWGLFLAEPISDLLAATTTLCMFRYRSKKLFATPAK
ncbi:MATE family efflux transporter [Pygmaiobacter massiliensis]|uniref:MATE family efflux transporter n=1 Tax=Pygmaiobacter massiliensis TaxID=1917873 RepID=UPI000C7B60AC|nr:MATE family efflux transporter [Pygmaiobacter massiliensis]